MTTRAVTNIEKFKVIMALWNLWRDGDNKYLRFGQLIGNIIRTESELYNIEDFPLVEKLEKGYKKQYGSK